MEAECALDDTQLGGLSNHHHDRITGCYAIAVRFYTSDCAHTSLSHLDVTSNRMCFEDGGAWGPVVASRRGALALIAATASQMIAAIDAEDE